MASALVPEGTTLDRSLLDSVVDNTESKWNPDRNKSNMESATMESTKSNAERRLEAISGAVKNVKDKWGTKAWGWMKRAGHKAALGVLSVPDMPGQAMDATMEAARAGGKKASEAWEDVSGAAADYADEAGMAVIGIVEAARGKARDLKDRLDTSWENTKGRVNAAVEKGQARVAEWQRQNAEKKVADSFAKLIEAQQLYHSAKYELARIS